LAAAVLVALLPVQQLETMGRLDQVPCSVQSRVREVDTVAQLPVEVQAAAAAAAARARLPTMVEQARRIKAMPVETQFSRVRTLALAVAVERVLPPIMRQQPMALTAVLVSHQRLRDHQ
jgi:hypothetical protein